MGRDRVPRFLFQYQVIRSRLPTFKRRFIMLLHTPQRQVIIDPRVSFPYSSFYIYGLLQLLGNHNVKFSMHPFRQLSDPGWNMRFILLDNGQVTKYFIHTNDSYHIQQPDYAWCDIYGSVNANFTYYPHNQYPKLISLVPSFSIRAMPLLPTAAIALSNFCKAHHAILGRTEWNKYTNSHEINRWKNAKHFFGRYYKTCKHRCPYTAYTAPFQSTDNYVFFLSTLWYNHPDNQNDKGVNLRRAHFIRACQSIPNLRFEGGLLGDDTSSKDVFADVLATTGLPMSEWMAKTKQSALVFNTPAFWDCHGWKLGEYLAMGKCILSTPLSNDLPAPLVHGEHIHYVENTQDAMREAITYILSHPEYKQKLENGARTYWAKYGTPTQSLRLLGIK